MPKILQIGKHFYPDRGGIETVTQNISDALLPHDIIADVLCLKSLKEYRELDRKYDVYRTASQFSIGNKYFSTEYLIQISKLQNGYDCAIIHMPHPLAAIGVLAFWRKPYVLLWHADIPQKPIRALMSPIDRSLIFRSAANIGPTPVHLTGSHHSEQLLPKQQIIGFPFDKSRWPPPTRGSKTARKIIEFANGRKIILSVGRLVGYKGFDILIASANKLSDQSVIVIVGQGPLYATLQNQIDQADLADRVILTGGVEEQDIADLFSICDIVTMPSVSAAEMYGMTQVEAMSFGKPLVSTNIIGSGVPYVNKHDFTGLVVEPRDSAALATALNRLIDDDVLYARLSAGASRSFNENHDMESFGLKFADLIKSIC
jgi:glycosyltransferase involved in cell wall biosynthesis